MNIGGRLGDEKTVSKSDRFLNAAVPVAVGAVSMGALVGLELSKGKAQDKLVNDCILSEIYEDDPNHDFHVEGYEDS